MAEPEPSTVQRWSSDGYERHARFVSDLGAAVLDWLDPRPGERILDLGCGDGVLTLKRVERGARVVGVDTSPSLLEAARARGIDARLMDGEALDFDAEFDAVFSNAALHWMTRADTVAAGVRRALKPQGRFVAEFGGHGNVAAIVTALRAAARLHGGDQDVAGPWFYPTADEYRALLEANGFQVERIALIPRPTPLPTGIAGWLETFRRPFVDQFPAETRAKVIAEVESLLAPSLRDRSGNWTADYVRLRVAARAA
jgi:SAM-dependent methyltransferase